MEKINSWLVVGRGGFALASVGIPIASCIACWREPIISICINTRRIVHSCGVVGIRVTGERVWIEKGCVFCWAEQRGRRRIFIWTGTWKMFGCSRSLSNTSRWLFSIYSLRLYSCEYISSNFIILWVCTEGLHHFTLSPSSTLYSFAKKCICESILSRQATKDQTPRTNFRRVGVRVGGSPYNLSEFLSWYLCQAITICCERYLVRWANRRPPYRWYRHLVVTYHWLGQMPDEWKPALQRLTKAFPPIYSIEGLGKSLNREYLKSQVLPLILCLQGSPGCTCKSACLDFLQHALRGPAASWEKKKLCYKNCRIALPQRFSITVSARWPSPKE